MTAKQAYMRAYYVANRKRLREWHKNYAITHKAERKAYLIRTKEHQIDVQRKRTLKRYYNLSISDYNALLSQQQNCCAICGMKSENNRYGRLCVDHSHKTNKIRGLLCIYCNTGLGAFKDNVQFMALALNYLVLHGEDIGKMVSYKKAENIRIAVKKLVSLLNREGDQ